jgi:hypothetical protein
MVPVFHISWRVRNNFFFRGGGRFIHNPADSALLYGGHFCLCYPHSLVISITQEESRQGAGPRFKTGTYLAEGDVLKISLRFTLTSYCSPHSATHHPPQLQLTPLNYSTVRLTTLTLTPHSTHLPLTQSLSYVSHSPQQALPYPDLGVTRN